MPIKYVPFIPEPVEGQAVLGNFNRILRYKGADDVSMTLQRGMPLYEMEKQETVGENADGNMVIRGEFVKNGLMDRLQWKLTTKKLLELQK